MSHVIVRYNVYIYIYIYDDNNILILRRVEWKHRIWTMCMSLDFFELDVNCHSL